MIHWHCEVFETKLLKLQRFAFKVRFNGFGCLHMLAWCGSD